MRSCESGACRVCEWLKLAELAIVTVGGSVEDERLSCTMVYERKSRSDQLSEHLGAVCAREGAKQVLSGDLPVCRGLCEMEGAMLCSRPIRGETCGSLAPGVLCAGTTPLVGKKEFRVLLIFTGIPSSDQMQLSLPASSHRRVLTSAPFETTNTVRDPM